MKKICLLIIVLILTGCGIEEESTKLTNKKWVDGKIFYYISPEIKQNKTLRDRIYFVLDEIEDKTSIEFYECDEKKPYVVVFIADEKINSATLGMCKNPVVRLNSFSTKIIFHEVFHVLGFPHEHQRPDRDDYVTVNMEDVSPTIRGDFEIYNEDMFLYDYWKYPYDYKSILHYKSNTYGVSMVKVSTGVEIITNNRPSVLDWKKLQEVYGG